jgi:hypothetical protein
MLLASSERPTPAPSTPQLSELRGRPAKIGEIVRSLDVAYDCRDYAAGADIESGKNSGLWPG